MTEAKKKEFLENHIPHRLTLLRAFKVRQDWFNGAGKDYGDLYRCSKDAALISIRLFTDALGLWVKKNGELCDKSHKDFNERKKRKEKNDDVRIDDLGFQLVTLDELTENEKKLLSAMYKRADKELAHLTLTYDPEFNTPEKFIDCIELIERLVQKHVYSGGPLPPVDVGDYPTQSYSESNRALDDLV